MIRRFVVAMLAGSLGGCMGDLPPEDFPCLVEQELYNKYNEAYVFSPQGAKKRQAMARIVEVEEACRAGESIVDEESASEGEGSNLAQIQQEAVQ